LEFSAFKRYARCRGSNKILTKRPYTEKLYVIKQIVSSHGAGPSYQLTEERSGKDLRRLVTFDRLKHYSFNLSSVRDESASSVVKACFKPALKILKDRVVHGEREFLVLFKDKVTKWRKRTLIGDGLLNAYRRQTGRMPRSRDKKNQIFGPTGG